jgi:ketosteroid isomerase-like protein
MSEHVEKLRAAYQTWHDTKGTCVAVWMELFADDMCIKSLPNGAEGLGFTAHRTGRAAIEGYFSDLARDWEMIHYTPEEFIAQGDRVVVLGRCAFRHRGTGRSAESPKVDVWRFQDGKAVEFRDFFDTALAQAASRPA